MSGPESIIYFFTTFPKESEQFLQREVRLLIKEFPEIQLISIHKGSNVFENTPVFRFSKWKLGKLLWWMPYWALARPRAFFQTLGELVRYPCPDFLNFQETLLGLAYALIQGRSFQKSKKTFPVHHASWATMPASATLLLKRLTGLPFSMEAHAYDIFKGSGDWLIQPKIKEAEWIRTSTEAGRSRLIHLGTREDKVLLVRRGLPEFPPFPAETRLPDLNCLEIINVGRFVAKKGLFQLLDIAKHLLASDISFRLTLIGDGPLRKDLENRLQTLNLSKVIQLTGFLSPEDLESYYARSHFLFFCGQVGPDGDRDGLPNVIPEAMARGIVVFSTNVGATSEAIQDGATGYLLSTEYPDLWGKKITELVEDPQEIQKIRRSARTWVEENYYLPNNLSALVQGLKTHREQPKQ